MFCCDFYRYIIHSFSTGPPLTIWPFQVTYNVAAFQQSFSSYNCCMKPINSLWKLGSQPISNYRKWGSQPISNNRKLGSQPISNNRKLGSQPISNNRKSGSQPISNNRKSGSQPIISNRSSCHGLPNPWDATIKSVGTQLSTD